MALFHTAKQYLFKRDNNFFRMSFTASKCSSLILLKGWQTRMKVTGWGRRRRKRWSRRRRAFPNWFRPLRVGYVPDLVRPPGRNQPPLLKCTHTHVHKIGAGKKSYVATYRNSHVRKRPQTFRRGRIWEMRAHWAEQEWRRNLLWKGTRGGGGGVGWLGKSARPRPDKMLLPLFINNNNNNNNNINNTIWYDFSIICLMSSLFAF